VSAFARPIFGDNACAIEINFVCHPLDQHSRARHNGSNLERPFQKSFEKQNAHWESEQFTAVFGLSSGETVLTGLNSGVFLPVSGKRLTLILVFMMMI